MDRIGYRYLQLRSDGDELSKAFCERAVTAHL
jgi:hypothetical protein